MATDTTTTTTSSQPSGSGNTTDTGTEPTENAGGKTGDVIITG
jgi:hypothetical protein